MVTGPRADVRETGRRWSLRQVVLYWPLFRPGGRTDHGQATVVDRAIALPDGTVALASSVPLLYGDEEPHAVAGSSIDLPCPSYADGVQIRFLRATATAERRQNPTANPVKTGWIPAKSTRRPTSGVATPADSWPKR